MSIVLIGFKNSGKTAVGKLISEKTKKIFIDTDRLIEQRYHTTEKAPLSVREIYQDKGEKYFRNLEKTIILSLKNNPNQIIATGGGSVLDADNVAHLKSLGKLVYLYASFKVLLSRSPLNLDFLDPFNQEREKIYQSGADVILFTENKSVANIADEIIDLTVTSTQRQ